MTHMSQYLLTVAASAVLLFGGVAHADTVQPKFNLSGVWQGDTGGVSSYFQEGTQLTFINTTEEYSHLYNGRYIGPRKIEGIQYRVNRATGCSTSMLLTLTALSDDAVLVWAKVLDSNCDLQQGQILTGSGIRTN